MSLSKKKIMIELSKRLSTTLLLKPLLKNQTTIRKEKKIVLRRLDIFMMIFPIKW